MSITIQDLTPHGNLMLQSVIPPPYTPHLLSGVLIHDTVTPGKLNKLRATLYILNSDYSSKKDHLIHLCLLSIPKWPKYN